MHQRTFARVAPMRAKSLLLRVRAWSRSSWRGGSTTCRCCTARSTRSEALRAAFRHRRRLRAARQHPRSQRQRARALAAVGERLRGAARHRRSRRRPYASCRASSASSTPQSIAALHDRALVVRLDRAQSFARRGRPRARARIWPASSSKKKTPACASIPAAGWHRRCSASSAPMKTVSTASSTRSTTCCAAVPAASCSRPTSSAARFRSAASASSSRRLPGTTSS